MVKANIFSISFSSTNTHVHSSGLDGLIHRYDLSRLSPTPTSTVAGEGPERTVHVNEVGPPVTSLAYGDRD